jgi:hypothetical protein
MVAIGAAVAFCRRRLGAILAGGYTISLAASLAIVFSLHGSGFAITSGHLLGPGEYIGVRPWGDASRRGPDQNRDKSVAGTPRPPGRRDRTGGGRDPAQRGRHHHHRLIARCLPRGMLIARNSEPGRIVEPNRTRAPLHRCDQAADRRPDRAGWAKPTRTGSLIADIGTQTHPSFSRREFTKSTRST